MKFVVAMKLEQEELARLERLESCASAARLPEVDLVYSGLGGQEAEPVEVGDADEEAHSVGQLTEKASTEVFKPPWRPCWSCIAGALAPHSAGSSCPLGTRP
jgi:hypothetical protein